MKRFFLGIIEGIIIMLIWVVGCFIADDIIKPNAARCWIMLFGVCVFCVQTCFISVWNRWFGCK